MSLHSRHRASMLPTTDFNLPPSSKQESLALDDSNRIRLSPRYLSKWGDDEIVIDTSDPDAMGTHIRTIKLHELSLSCAGDGIGIYQGVMPLSHFPHFWESLKWSLNRRLLAHTAGEVADHVSQHVRTCLLIFSRLIQKGIYALSDCTQSDIDEITQEVTKVSWRGVLRLNRHLLLLGLRIQKEPELAHKYAGTGNFNRFTVHIKSLEFDLGIPIGSNHVPNWFRRRLAKLVGDNRVYRSVPYARPKGNHYEVSSTLRTLRYLSFGPAGIDAFDFQPFTNILKSATELIPPNRAQTSNLSTDEMARILDESLKWVYDRGPQLVAILRAIRISFCNDEPVEFNFSTPEIVELEFFNSMINSGVIRNPGSHSKLRVFETALIQCMVGAGNVIAINHGRRINEVYGHQKHFGAHYGCVQRISETPRAFQAEFYIQKGPNEYRAFPANALVARAVALLEAFHDEFALMADEPPADFQQASRKKRLFRIRSLHKFKFGEWKQPDWRVAISTFLSNCGIDPQKWQRQPVPFRRVYATLYMRRYDLPELPGLQLQLAHFATNSSIGYHTDSVRRPIGHSVSELHPKHKDSDTASVLKHLQEARLEYIVDLVKGLLTGRKTGGVFPRVILKLARRLSANSDFSRLAVERKAIRLAEVWTERKFSLEPQRHVACTAGASHHSVAAAKCARNGELHPESASPKMCEGCFHSWHNQSYWDRALEERDRCLEQAAKPGLPTPIVASLQRQAAQLTEIVAREQAFAEGTASMLNDLSDIWKTMMGETYA